MTGREGSCGTLSWLVGMSTQLAACVSVRGRAREREQGREREAGCARRGAEERRREERGASAPASMRTASLFRAQLIWLSVGVNAAV